MKNTFHPDWHFFCFVLLLFRISFILLGMFEIFLTSIHTTPSRWGSIGQEARYMTEQYPCHFVVRSCKSSRISCDRYDRMSPAKQKAYWITLNARMHFNPRCDRTKWTGILLCMRVGNFVFPSKDVILSVFSVVYNKKFYCV